jgi:hypothetical protein
MQALTARFQQLAGEVSDEYVSLHGKLAMLARTLPERYAEIVLHEDAKRPVPALHQVIDTVLSRATHKEHAFTYASASAAFASATPLNLDAMSLAAFASKTFGWSPEEARTNMREEAGSPHAPRASAAAAAAAVPAPFGASARNEEQLNRLKKSVAALAARLDKMGVTGTADS